MSHALIFGLNFNIFSYRSSMAEFPGTVKDVDITTSANRAYYDMVSLEDNAYEPVRDRAYEAVRDHAYEAVGLPSQTPLFIEGMYTNISILPSSHQPLPATPPPAPLKPTAGDVGVAREEERA